MWSAGGVDRLVGMADLPGPEGVRAYFTEVFSAFPDFDFEVLSMTAEDDRCAVRWRATGTFAGPGSFQGLAPTGARVELEGCRSAPDVPMARSSATTPTSTQPTSPASSALMPPRGSKAEQRLTRSSTPGPRSARSSPPREPERVADGVWLIRGGFPSKTMNIYLIEDEGGVTSSTPGSSR